MEEAEVWRPGLAALFQVLTHFPHLSQVAWIEAHGLFGSAI